MRSRRADNPRTCAVNKNTRATSIDGRAVGLFPGPGIRRYLLPSVRHPLIVSADVCFF